MAKPRNNMASSYKKAAKTITQSKAVAKVPAGNPFARPGGWGANYPWNKKPAAAAQPTASAQPAAAAQPARERTKPFLTADDQAQFDGMIQEWLAKLQDIDSQLAQMTSDTTYQKTQGNKAATANKAQASDDAAARGLFQSSIRDAALYDIEAQRTLQQKFLDDRLTAAHTDASNKKHWFNTEFKPWVEGIKAQKGAENANAVEATLPPPPEPPGAAPAPGAPKAGEQPKTTGSKPQPTLKAGNPFARPGGYGANYSWNKANLKAAAGQLVGTATPQQGGLGKPRKPKAPRSGRGTV